MADPKHPTDPDYRGDIEATTDTLQPDDSDADDDGGSSDGGGNGE